MRLPTSKKTGSKRLLSASGFDMKFCYEDVTMAIFTCHVPSIKVFRKRETGLFTVYASTPCGSRVHSCNECMCGVQLYTGILSAYDDVLITFVPILDVKGLTER